MKYFVRVVRPRFEFQLLEVEAGDRSSAEELAVMEAAELTSGWRELIYSPSQYAPHAEITLPEQDVADPEDREAMCSAQPSDWVYMLLQANTFTGEGRMVWEPWFSEVTTSTAEDLLDEWRDDLEFFAQGDTDDDDDGRPSANVLQFRHRAKSTPPDDE